MNGHSGYKSGKHKFSSVSLKLYLFGHKKTVVIGCEDRLTHLQVSSLNLVLINENMYSTRVYWVEFKASLHS